MSRIVFFIDGFNLYHALISNPKYRKYKWLNYSKLAECFVHSKDQIVKIFYFTSYATWDQAKMARHKRFIAALESTGIETVRGKFKIRDKRCRICKRKYKIPEEKETDVNISVKLFQIAIDDLYDIGILVSADTDLVPAIKALKSSFPEKEMRVIFPIGRYAEALKKIVDSPPMRMKEHHIKTCQFPDVVDLGNGKQVEKPESW